MKTSSIIIVVVLIVVVLAGLLFFIKRGDAPIKADDTDGTGTPPKVDDTDGTAVNETAPSDTLPSATKPSATVQNTESTGFKKVMDSLFRRSQPIKITLYKSELEAMTQEEKIKLRDTVFANPNMAKYLQIV